MSDKEALYLVIGLLQKEQDPTYKAMLTTCKNALQKKIGAERLAWETQRWPHCSKCGKPYIFEQLSKECRLLHQPCGCHAPVEWKLRPKEVA